MGQRIIKFRAWEKYDEDYAKEMDVLGKMHFSNEWPDEDIQDKRTVVIAGFYHDSGWDSDNFTIMQFTGLKDSRRKDIYEDDILLLVDGTKKVVKFETLCWGIPFDSSHVEIIGNVFQNPELLLTNNT